MSQVGPLTAGVLLARKTFVEGLSACLVVGLACAGCVGTSTRAESYVLRVETDPPHAHVSVDGRSVGAAPTDVKGTREAEVYSFHRAWWLVAVAAGGATTGGTILLRHINNAEPGSAQTSLAATLVSAGLGATLYAIYACLMGEAADGEYVNEPDRDVEIRAEAEGFLPASARVRVPHADSVHLSLRAEAPFPGLPRLPWVDAATTPAPAHAETPAPASPATQTAALAAASASASASASAPAHASTPAKTSRVLAVFDVEDQRARDRLSPSSLRQLTEYVRARFGEAAAYSVVPNSALRTRLVAEKDESYRPCFDDACRIEIGKAAAAEVGLVTKIARIGRTCVVSLFLYDLRTETAESTETARTRDCSAEGLLGAVDGPIQALSNQR
ncbi:MAG: hypothetical protein H6729_05070 [Deltaproteobacteria bacterium]|nr:hypothetical protein [Deltaproteobacteria bacterium]